MRIHYLGTAAAEGWPAAFCRCEACVRARTLGGKNLRSRAQAVINEELLVDFGPDTYLHALYGGLDLPGIHSVLVTHAHQDHWYPDELAMRGEPYAHETPESLLTVYGCADVKRGYDAAMTLSDSDNMARRVRFAEAREAVPFETEEGYRVTPLLARHDPHQKCLIYLIEREGKALLYAHDTGFFPEETWACLAGKRLNLVSLDCTSMAEGDGSYHMGLPDDRRVKERLLAMGCADEQTLFVVNHFSHNGGVPHDEMEKLAGKDGFLVSWDGRTLEI